jgi:hypothetical protein
VNWSDEHYVKLFTRDTVTWRSWPWQARALFPLLMRAVDGAGMLSVGTRELARSVALMVDMPSDIVLPGIKALLDDGTVELANGTLIVTKFLEAQESRKSDAQSKRDVRERAKAVARAKQLGVIVGTPVRPSPTVSDDVQSCPPPAQPSPALLTTLSSELDAPPLSFATVFGHWQKVMGRQDAKPIDKRRRAVAARLREGYTVEQLKLAVDGCARTPHNMGANDQHRRFDDLELICRNGAQVERFISNATGPPATAAVRVLTAEDRKNLYADQETA